MFKIKIKIKIDLTLIASDGESVPGGPPLIVYCHNAACHSELGAANARETVLFPTIKFIHKCRAFSYTYFVLKYFVKPFTILPTSNFFHNSVCQLYCYACILLVFSQPSIYIDGWLYAMSMTSVVCNVPVLSQNDSTYHHSVFTT